MGLNPEDYYRMSPLEFYYASKGYMQKYWKEWDRTRHLMYTIASTIPSKKKMPHINRFMPLPIDRKGGITADRANDMFEQLKKKLNGKRITGKDNSGHVRTEKQP